jgi:hypothetical protein
VEEVVEVTTEIIIKQEEDMVMIKVVDMEEVETSLQQIVFLCDLIKPIHQHLLGNQKLIKVIKLFYQGQLCMN